VIRIRSPLVALVVLAVAGAFPVVAWRVL